ncbi:hypothetical protein N8I77_006075 [Diaporthe amygdali]|uniref:Uncharacterized protein n=1 Tax=Phomopsis amygdali TaxID=1214568 RepID=A0AAD9W3L8_PHOAM|nr:hypothetical protein N8I77_006075 [Diaporthe amygdali]
MADDASSMAVTSVHEAAGSGIKSNTPSLWATFSAPGTTYPRATTTAAKFIWVCPVWFVAEFVKMSRKASRSAGTKTTSARLAMSGTDVGGARVEASAILTAALKAATTT